MCLVTYSDSLPNLMHEEVMRCVESQAGQDAEIFAEALFRVTMKDGRNALNALHSAGLIKKVPVNQVMLTPTTSTKVSLEEINKIVDQIKAGNSASKKLKNLDTSKPVETKLAEALTDSDLATQRTDQAVRMRKQAEQLLAEADKLELEARALLSESPLTATNATTKKRAAANARKKAPTAES